MATELEILRNKAEALFNEKKYTEIIQLLTDEALTKHQDARLFAWKARAHHGLGEINYALNYAEKSIEVDDQYWMGYFVRGNLVRLNSDNDKAIIDYTKAIELKSDYPSTYVNRGLSWYSKGEYDKAINDFSKAIELDSDEAVFYFNRGASWYSKDEFDKAITDFNKAIELNHSDANTYYIRGRVWKNKGEYEKAIDDFNKFIEFNHDKGDIWVEMANSSIQELTKLLANKKLDDIAETIKEVKDLLMFKDGCITHYTGLSTGKILVLDKGSKLRISEGAFLNDTSEGRELLRYLDVKFTKKQKDNDTLAEPFTPKPFIGSFVEEKKHNDLNLWRMYGKEEKEEARGCALTIKSKELIDGINSMLSPGTDKTMSSDDINFYRVAYRLSDKTDEFTVPELDDEKTIELNQLIKKLKEQVAEYVEGDDSMKDLETYINRIAFLFKSDVYRSENEIRLVVNGIGFTKETNSDITPPRVYINLVNIKPMIKKITLGPKVSKPDEWAAAFYYSYKSDAEIPEILISHLPFK